MDPSQVPHFQPPPPQPPPFSAVSAAYVHPTPAPNPTPTLPSHPSYTEMITAAILWENSQGKEGGSSKRAISKYIDRVYTNLPPTHSALLTHHLKRLKNSGQLVMIKNSYQLPSFSSPMKSVPPQLQQPSPYHAPSASDTSLTPKRKVGRPPKPKQAQQPQAQLQQPQEVVVSDSGLGLGLGSGSVGVNGKRPRGRPPKQQEVVVPFVQPIPETGNVSVNPSIELSNGTQVKRRGRPPKKQPLQEMVQPQPVFQVEVEEPQALNGVEAVKKRPGRPAKLNVGAIGRGRGRPAKLNVGAIGRGRGRPKKINTSISSSSNNNNVLGTVSEGVGKKKRGWPRGRPRGKRVVAVMVGNVGGGGVKRRGRKPKGGVPGVVNVEKRLYSGKPRGRPKKNSVIVKHTSEQVQELANEELLKKLEDMQSKIRDAVGVIRPHVADQSAPDALAALQQLEELSSMNVTSSPALIAPPVSINVTAPPPITSGPSLTDPTLMAFTATTGMSVPLSFSMNVPSMTVTAPLHAPPSTENHEPMSWGPPSEAKS